MNTVFPWIIAGAIISIFAPKVGDYLREGIIIPLREAINSNISQEPGCALNILF